MEKEREAVILIIMNDLLKEIWENKNRIQALEARLKKLEDAVFTDGR